jgi:hypothetical protein
MHMFNRDPWFGGKAAGQPKTGVRPGPVPVNMPNFQAKPTTGISGPIQAPAAQPAAAPKTPGGVPIGSKADCPVCRTFGK